MGRGPFHPMYRRRKREKIICHFQCFQPDPSKTCLLWFQPFLKLLEIPKIAQLVFNSLKTLISPLLLPTHLNKTYLNASKIKVYAYDNLFGYDLKMRWFCIEYWTDQWLGFIFIFIIISFFFLSNH